MMQSPQTGRENILETIQEALSPWLGSLKIRESTDLVSEVGIDSVAILQVILSLENTYQIRIPDHDIDGDMLSSVSRFIDFVESVIHAAR